MLGHHPQVARPHTQENQTWEGENCQLVVGLFRVKAVDDRDIMIVDQVDYSQVRALGGKHIVPRRFDDYAVDPSRSLVAKIRNTVRYNICRHL